VDWIECAYDRIQLAFVFNTWTTYQVLNTFWTGDADLRLYITTVQDG